MIYRQHKIPKYNAIVTLKTKNIYAILLWDFLKTWQSDNNIRYLERFDEIFFPLSYGLIKHKCMNRSLHSCKKIK